MRFFNDNQGKSRPHFKAFGGAGHLISLWSEPATGGTRHTNDTFSATLLPSVQIALGISTAQPEEVDRPFLIALLPAGAGGDKL